MKTIAVNDSLTFATEESDNGLLMNGELVNFDLKTISQGNYHVLMNNLSYTAELISLDRKRKQALIKVNGRVHTVSLSDEYDNLLKDLGIETTGNADAGMLKAPMPGLVLHLLVKPGDVLKKGDGFLVLEAMKMENLIKAQTDICITSVEVSEGDKVEKNQILLRYDTLPA